MEKITKNKLEEIFANENKRVKWYLYTVKSFEELLERFIERAHKEKDIELRIKVYDKRVTYYNLEEVIDGFDILCMLKDSGYDICGAAKIKQIGDEIDCFLKNLIEKHEIKPEKTITTTNEIVYDGSDILLPYVDFIKK